MGVSSKHTSCLNNFAMQNRNKHCVCFSSQKLPCLKQPYLLYLSHISAATNQQVGGSSPFQRTKKPLGIYYLMAFYYIRIKRLEPASGGSKFCEPKRAKNLEETVRWTVSQQLHFSRVLSGVPKQRSRYLSASLFFYMLGQF